MRISIFPSFLMGDNSVFLESFNVVMGDICILNLKFESVNVDSIITVYCVLFFRD